MKKLLEEINNILNEEENSEVHSYDYQGNIISDEYKLINIEGDIATVKDLETGSIEKWIRRPDGVAGASIEINGEEYEFVSSNS